MITTAERRLARAHAHARSRQPGRVYAIIRTLAVAGLRGWFQLRVTGVEHLPARGRAIIAANHKSFLDAFFLALTTRRELRFMAKAGLFRGPLGWLLPRLGAFPVRRGEADSDALATATAILGQGGLLVVFPEGTRVDEPDALGSPHHGAGRLAIESRAPIVPAAIRGTSQLWLGPVPKPRRVDVSFVAPVHPERAASATDVRAALEDLIDRQVWPAVQTEYGRLQATPGVIAVILAAIGFGGLAARRGVAGGRLPRPLGIAQPRKARRRTRLKAAPDRLRRR